MNARREKIVARFAAHLGAGVPGRPLALCAPLADSLAELDAPSEKLLEHYCDRSPERLVAQWRAMPPSIAELVGLRWADDASLAQPIARLFDAIAAAGISPLQHSGSPDVAALAAARPTLAALYFGSLFGGSLPFVGLLPEQQTALAARLAAGDDPLALARHHLLANLLHELCHGRRRDGGAILPWLLVEAAAVHLGATVERRHIFPDHEGEAVPGVVRFVLLGAGLARLCGRGAVWRLLLGEPLRECFSPAVAAALLAAERAERRRHPDELFAAEAERFGDWLRLVDAARAGEILTLDEARVRPWASLPWAAEPLGEDDHELLRWSIEALFLSHRMALGFSVAPSEIPDRSVRLDVASAELRVASRPDSIWLDPAVGLCPPSLAAALARRGCHAVVARGVTRDARARLGDALLELAAGSSPLPPTVELACS